MSNRKAPEAYMGGNLLAGDIFQMLGLPSPGGFTTPLQSITDSVMGPGSFQNFQNAGTKKLLDVFLKGAIGGGKRPRKARHVASPTPKVCRHKYPKRCKCPKGEGAGIFDNLKDYVKLWEPEKVLGKIGDLALGKVVKHALGGSVIAARVNGFVADPQVQKDIHKLFARAMTDMLVKHEKSGEAIPMDHPIMMESGPVVSGSGRRRRVVGASWTKWLNPLYLAKRALHATHIDRIINKIPVVGNIAAATGVTGGKRPRGRPRKHPKKVRGGAAPVFDNDEADRMPQKYHIEEWGVMEPRQREDDERSEEGSVAGPMTKKERQAKYRHENREKLREKQRQYREAKKVRVI